MIARGDIGCASSFQLLVSDLLVVQTTLTDGFSRYEWTRNHVQVKPYGIVLDHH
jgi:hypothetical protein